jgi:predicted amidohydrolase
MPTWKIAAVQMDCKLGDVPANLSRITARLAKAAQAGARLTVFPECALTGYAFDSKDEAWPHAEDLEGPSIQLLAETCRRLDVYAVVGGLEQDCDRLFNVSWLFGPGGFIARYRKIHLPFLGVDRFTTPGNEPFDVQVLDGLRIGMSICYDGSFPESTRVLMLLGADLVVLPTNWPVGAESTVCHLVQSRALENHVFYAAVNRVGTEKKTRYIGQSKIVSVNGELLAAAGADEETILYAEIDPDRARNKQIVRIPGVYQLHRVNDRRPEMYGELCRNQK